MEAQEDRRRPPATEGGDPGIAHVIECHPRPRPEPGGGLGRPVLPQLVGVHAERQTGGRGRRPHPLQVIERERDVLDVDVDRIGESSAAAAGSSLATLHAPILTGPAVGKPRDTRAA